MKADDLSCDRRVGETARGTFFGKSARKQRFGAVYGQAFAARVVGAGSRARNARNFAFRRPPDHGVIIRVFFARKVDHALENKTVFRLFALLVPLGFHVLCGHEFHQTVHVKGKVYVPRRVKHIFRIKRTFYALLPIHRNAYGQLHALRAGEIIRRCGSIDGVTLRPLARLRRRARERYGRICSVRPLDTREKGDIRLLALVREGKQRERAFVRRDISRLICP